MDLLNNKNSQELNLEQTEKSPGLIKASRVQRKKQIDINQNFHKKNPKSIAYYKSLTEVMAEAKDAKESIVSNEVVSQAKTNTKQFKESMQKSAQSKPDIKPKLKYQLQLMINNLEKSLKREGVFLQTSSDYRKIRVFKDYSVPVNLLKGKKHTLGLRCEIGVWRDFFDTVREQPFNFSDLKNRFSQWLRSAKQSYDATSDAQDFFDKYLNNVELPDNTKKQIHRLEEGFLKNLRRPGKQPYGFKTKGLNIYASWLNQAQEVSHIEEIETQLNLQSYEQTFPLARMMKRKISIFVGPTNSGKTYAAFNELQKAERGSYLAPLRLMAAEGQEALFDRGIVTSLVTGEEQKMIDEATHVSSTIEMCQLNQVVDVAVIDEIQMIADKARGWAWSQALIGVPAKHLILVGSPEALPLIMPVIETLGEEYEIQTFERKAPLTHREAIWRLQDLKQGDCVVVFSRKNALQMKNEIEATGKKCSVIYGNLSPDVRRSEANKFKNHENPILVATDAIGMGLNLPINRLFFSTLQKYDGEESRYLTISEIKQIAGRSGRYGLTQTGEVGLLADNSMASNELLKKAIYKGYDPIEDTRVPIGPNIKQIYTICDVIGKEDLYSALIFFKEKLIRKNPIYKAANLESMIEVAGMLKNKNLALESGLTYSCVPIDTNSEYHVKYFHQWVGTHLRGEAINAPELPDVVNYNKTDSNSLFEAENYVKLCMAYRWLHYKYPDFYPDIDVVSKNANIANQFIEKSLHKHIVIAKNPKWRR